MQKRILFIILSLTGILQLGYGQNVPNYIEKPSIKTAQQTPTNLADPSSRCIRSLTPQIPLQDTFNVNLFSTIETVQVSTQYFDAMGRPLQTVIKQASPAKKDFVSPAAFDFFGNPSTQYLPYTAQTGNADDGKLKASPFKDDSIFYKTFLPDEQKPKWKMLAAWR